MQQYFLNYAIIDNLSLWGCDRLNKIIPSRKLGVCVAVLVIINNLKMFARR